jgi:hypothetical protein
MIETSHVDMPKGVTQMDARRPRDNLAVVKGDVSTPLLCNAMQIEYADAGASLWPPSQEMFNSFVASPPSLGYGPRRAALLFSACTVRYFPYSAY